jgi:hypothetical protein
VTYATAMMDALLCGILTALEIQYLPQLRHLDIGALKASIIFLIQYLSLKFYRLYLYPKHLSPLRKLPGPKVCYGINCNFGD